MTQCIISYGNGKHDDPNWHNARKLLASNEVHSGSGTADYPRIPLIELKIPELQLEREEGCFIVRMTFKEFQEMAKAMGVA